MSWFTELFLGDTGSQDSTYQTMEIKDGKMWITSYSKERGFIGLRVVDQPVLHIDENGDLIRTSEGIKTNVTKESYQGREWQYYIDKLIQAPQRQMQKEIEELKKELAELKGEKK